MVGKKKDHHGNYEQALTRGCVSVARKKMLKTNENILGLSAKQRKIVNKK